MILTKDWRKGKGITLIALVVTIIVLLILAGISISMLTGENGIINRASEASEKTEDANDLEYLRTEAYGELIEYYSSGSSLSEQDYVLQKLGEKEGITVNQTAGTVTYNGKTYNISELLGNSDEQNSLASNGLTQVTDSPLLTENENIRMVLQEETESGTLQAVIPAGFYYVTGKPSTGLVISDVQGDDDQNTKGGNQFVWVPCDGEYLTYEAENGLGATWKEKYAKNDKGEYVNYQSWYTTYGVATKDENGNPKTEHVPIKGTWTDTGGDLESVQKYGGFYVARFEAGVPNETFYSTEDGAEYVKTSVKDTNTLSPVSKKNTFSWNYISQQNAVAVSAKMYQDSTSVTSSLIDSYAWDTIVEWMEKNQAGIAKNCNNKGNYTNSTFSVNNGLYAYHRLESLTAEATRINNLIDKGEMEGTKYSAGGWNASIYKTGGPLTLGYDNSITQEENNNYGLAGFEFKNPTYYYYNLYKEIQTGSAEETKINNIYDMAGNMWEWTTETGNPDGTSTTRAVRRGGSFYHSGSGSPVSCRYGSDAASWANINFGFRVVLYIK